MTEERTEAYNDEEIAELPESIQACLYEARGEILSVLQELWEDDVKHFGFRFETDEYYGTNITEESKIEFRTQFYKDWTVKEFKQELMKSKRFDDILADLLDKFSDYAEIPDYLAEPEQHDYDAMYKLARGG
jgi:hypothetical protein